MGINNKKILILVPSLDVIGGIANYYRVLKKEFNLDVEYFIRGSRNYPIIESQLKELFRLIHDYFKFIYKIYFNKYGLIQITVPVSKNTLIRDGLFVLLSKLRGIKTIIFFRGWQNHVLNRIEKKYLKIFKIIFFRVDAIIELSKKNKNILEKWGYERKIYLETTLIDNNLLREINEDFISNKYSCSDEIHILFLSRIEKIKGIYIAINAFNKLQTKIKKRTKLHIVGKGNEMKNVINFIKSEGIDNIKLHGFLNDHEKADLYKKSHIFLFPTMHGEGMSNSIIEALSFGLPVVTRPMGGNADILTENNGYVTLSKDPEIFCEMMINLIKTPGKMIKIALNNYQYAKKRFYAEKVVERIGKIYLETIKGR
jgi:glycosyltransferase involved in cell wall biosynthesis